MEKRVAIGNHKGGSDKTAFTINLSAALAEQGLRVLVGDLDPQANASRRLGFRFDPEDPAPTISEAIKANEPGVAAQAFTPCGWDEPYASRITLLPARFDLENRIPEAGTPGAPARLRKALRGADDEFDVVLLDCPPSLGHLTQLALTAADVALCSLVPDYDSVEGAVRFRDFITDRGEDIDNAELRLIGVLVSEVQERLSAQSFQLEGLPELFGDMVWKPYVPERTVVREAGAAAAPLAAWGNQKRAPEARDAYTALAQRLAKEVSGQ